MITRFKYSVYILLVSIPVIILPGSACETKLESRWQDNPYFSYRQITLKDGSTLHFALILPENPDLDLAYPVLLAFPPGTQDYEMVEWAIEKYWIRASIRNNWIVVSPMASGGVSFYEGGETAVPELMDWLQANYSVEGGKFHVAGMSAGGYSAFRIAIDYPQRIHSILAFPGYPPDPEDTALLDRLVSISVAMYAGQLDTEWVESMNATYDQLIAAGVTVTYQVMPLEGHVIQFTSDDLFQILNAFR
jgi:predicted esterase